jgi:hypothetical protein
VDVSPADRDAAEEAYVDQVLRFNERIEQVRARVAGRVALGAGHTRHQSLACDIINIERERPPALYVLLELGGMS